jgi:pimeloyl-ACP methyl ester carboxylesterase
VSKAKPASRRPAKGQSGEHGFIETNGVRLHYVTQGSGPLMLFLHGFPDFWYGWRHQLPEFAKDHTVVAIDMRGYNDSEKPAAKGAYAMDQLVGDVAGVIEQLGEGRAILVGHDWGGAVAWATANERPELIDRLVIMNIPHPAIMLKAIARPPQLFKSWYMFAFQLPLLPELFLTVNNAAATAAIFKGALVNKAAISDADLDQYRRAMTKPGAATAQINYYRNILGAPRGRGFQKLRMPTLLIWGEEDIVLGRELTEGTERWVEDLTLKFVPGCGHFVQQECPAEVNAIVRGFLARASQSPKPSAAKRPSRRPANRA